MTSTKVLPEPGASSWEALARGAWDEAFELFSAALEEDETAEGFEGLAWAAWWRNDAVTLFWARERAYRLFREAGNRRGAARAAIWLGCDYHDFRGEHAVAAGWHQRARRHLEGAEPCPEQGWLAFQEGAYALELADDTATAKRRAADAAAVGRTLAVADLEFLGLALEGLALVTEGAVAEGMARLDEAAVAATSGELEERIATTWTLCYLLYACERVRDLDRTAQWCRRMEEISARFAFDFGIGVCRAHYGGVLVLHGDWERAEQELVKAGHELARVRPPVVAESDARLGELRRRQGRLTEAAALFDRAEPHPLALIGQAAVALDRGEHGRAAEILEDLLAATPQTSVTQRADALELLVRARLAGAELEAADAAVTELEQVAAAIGTTSLRGMAALARGAVALAAGILDVARPRLEQAVDLFERSGLPYEAACARTELAGALHASGRSQAAAKQAQRASARLRELGAVPSAERAETLAMATPMPPTAAIGGQLTRRESEVLALVGLGLSDRDIADRLVISPHTVHRHVSNILAKLGVRSRAAAAAYAARHGLTAPERSG